MEPAPLPSPLPARASQGEGPLQRWWVLDAPRADCERRNLVKFSKPSKEGPQELRRSRGAHKDLLPRYYAFEDQRGALERNIQSSVWKEDGYRSILCELARRVIQVESSIYFYVARKSYT